MGGTFWVLAAAGFARARSGEWWGLVEGGQGGPETTPDGGREWDSRRSFPALDEVQVLSPRLIVGWQTAQAGFRHTMVMSDDGGGRWLRRPLPEVVYTSVFGAIYDLAFVNARDGWWSAGGQVWTTSDGGLRWWP